MRRILNVKLVATPAAIPRPHRTHRQPVCFLRFLCQWGYKKANTVWMLPCFDRNRKGMLSREGAHGPFREIFFRTLHEGHLKKEEQHDDQSF